MKKISELTTPNFLVDLDKFERNVKEMAEICKKNGKKLYPMVKTHKSADIAAIQSFHGAAGFLVGTIDEAEKLVLHGFKELMLAYPVAATENISRVVELTKKAHITLSFDGVEAAAQINDILLKEKIELDYLIIIDCGLHRFGVEPDKAVALVRELGKFSCLKFKGISTHPGHVYGKKNFSEVEEVAKEEIAALERAAGFLNEAGFVVSIVATGSTPTVAFTKDCKTVTALRPGNYIFYDAIQVALGVVSLERCAMTVLATIIAHPVDERFIIDAGSKCFGLDRGAHSISLVNGFGIVKGYPELIVESLSEEVGKIKISGNTSLKVGDKIEIIPNHTCASVNMTSFLIGHRRGVCERVFTVEARGGTNISSIRGQVEF